MAINPLAAAMQARAHLLPHGALRVRLARHAARRQSAAALRSTPEDPVVLAALGLYEPALARSSTDREGLIAHAIALAGIGRVPDALSAAADLDLDETDTVRLVLAGAPFAPGLLLPLAPGGRPLLRAALAFAADDFGETARMLAEAPAGRERAALAAGQAAARGRWAEARAAIAEMFAADGLASPLVAGEAPISLAALAAEQPRGLPEVRGQLVSVLVPVREAAETLQLAVGSLIAQSWRDLEILLVDDASSDGSAAIAAALAAQDTRVRLIANGGDRGAAGARNAGIAAACGDILLFHDADDWAHPGRVARQVAAMGGGVGSVSAHVRMDAAGVLRAPLVAPFVRYAPISLMVRAAAAARAGPIEIARVGSDSEYLARLDLLFGRRRLVRDPAVLTIFDWSPRSLSGDPLRGIGSIAGMAERRRYRHEWLLRHARMGLPLRRFRLSPP